MHSEQMIGPMKWSGDMRRDYFETALFVILSAVCCYAVGSIVKSFVEVILFGE